MNCIIGIVLVVVLTTIVFTMYCAMLVAGRSDENNKGYDDMILKKQLCPNCKTGKESYELDQHSESCPYIGYLKEGTCSFFESLENTSKKGIFSDLKNKQSFWNLRCTSLCRQRKRTLAETFIYSIISFVVDYVIWDDKEKIQMLIENLYERTVNKLQSINRMNISDK